MKISTPLKKVAKKQGIYYNTKNSDKDSFVLSPMPERSMTRRTFEELQARKEELKDRITRMGAESSGHQRESLHDDAGTQDALNLARSTLQKIGDLSRIRIIDSRTEKDSVGLGNKVRLQFEDGEETVSLLGRDDVIYRSDLGRTTSDDSPLGKAILGKRPGERVEVKLSPRETIKVKVLEIFPGDF